ncbi:MAG: hypothetical protein EO766_13170 [Hydrotalea sp. AMD]|uniref:hypothetical protein n=1 Tax=Hydrotalea sp. AMD TaxID=2501297 RepID=UPI0010286CDD|nr:hypothetical protein [Hydrotalea sp. AMD]RWZ86751.1 MAG: hypothetical protein EO766_13170 [Hydrotalea sp. AMD]
MITKLCTCCKQVKPVEEFYTSGCKKADAVKHYKSWCKSCETVKLRLWRKSNPDLYKQQHIRNKERVNAKKATNPEYAAKLLQQKRDNSRKNFISGMLSRAAQRAKKYKVDFDLTKEDIIIPDKCPLLNVPFKLGVKHDYQLSPSIDRIDPLKGYTKDNIKIISTLANTMKNSATKEQLLEFSKHINQYLNDI